MIMKKYSDKRQICVKNKTIAYASMLGGVEIKHIEYGIDDYVYCVSNAWYGKHHYHKVKLRFNNKSRMLYITLYGQKVTFDNMIRC